MRVKKWGVLLLFLLIINSGPIYAEEIELIEAQEMPAGMVLPEPKELLGASEISTSAVFTPRLTAPEKRTITSFGNPYYFEKNVFYEYGYGMPNCTAYAYGRAYEILGSQPKLSTGNANEWWDYNKSRGNYQSGTTPRVGAVICWNGSAYGHVAVVEKIEGNTVTYSESAWSGFYFRTNTYKIGAEDDTSVGGFQGYIYLGNFDVNINTDVTPPTISNLEIKDVDATGFTVSANVADVGSGVNNVSFPVWTSANGQDDLKWYTADVNAGVATKRIFYKDHGNERSLYIVHGYVYDKAGLVAVTGSEITAKAIDVAKPIISELEIKNVDNFGFTVSCRVADQDSGIDYVLFPTWTQNNGQDELIWYEIPVIDGIAQNRILYSEHKNERGLYTTHVYAYDKSGLLSVSPIDFKVPQNMIFANYRTHVQNIGWEKEMSHNGAVSGTSGKSLRLEGIEILASGKPAVVSADIAYSTHIQDIGWQDYKKNGQMSGTEGRSLRLEAIKIKLTGPEAADFDIYYRVHAQNVGWLDWAKNDAPAGTAGLSYRLEAIEIKILPKGVTPPGSLVKPFVQGN